MTYLYTAATAVLLWTILQVCLAFAAPETKNMSQEKYTHSVCIYIGGAGEYYLLHDMANEFKDQMVLRFINISKSKLATLSINPNQFKLQKPQAFVSCNTEQMKAYVISRLELYRRNREMLDTCYRAPSSMICEAEEPPHTNPNPFTDNPNKNIKPWGEYPPYFDNL